MIPIHPDDVLMFTEVSAAMRRVATKYDLPLKIITGLPLPRRGMFNRLGDCSGTGEIRLVLRCYNNGVWEDEPCSPQQIYDTAAHELAHLRFMNHGPEFQDFCEELQTAMNNQQKDHKQKMIEKLVKLQNSRQGEAELGNEEAAQAFAGMINKLLLEYELSPSDLDYNRAMDNDPVIELPVNLSTYRIESSKVRSAWQESLASGIANAHLCRILIRPGSNSIYFVGTKSHATVAEYVYGTMVPVIAKMSKTAEVQYWTSIGCPRGKNNTAKGYRAAWIDSFIERIWQRFAEARKAAIAAAPVSSETGLMRLDGALIKVRKYIDEKFAHRRAASRAGALNYRSRNHAEGREHGREAANKITLGQRGMTSGTPKKFIGEG